MRMTGSRAYSRSTRVPKMPAGLEELMEGMTKEVLKCNPTNIYEFCAAHMEKLLEIRDGPTGKRLLTLNEKILKAQNKIKIRAQHRWLKYDKEMQALCDIEHKGEDLPCKNTIIKGLVPHEMNLTSAEEIEIAQKPIVDENYCGNKNQSERNTEIVTLPVEIDSTNCNNNDHENLTFEVKHNIDIANNKIFSEPDNLIHLDSSMVSVNDKLCDNITITEVIQKNEENVLKDTNQISPIVSEQEIKEPEILLNPNNIQVIEHELIDTSDDKVEIINDNEKQKILSESEDKNIVIIKNDSVITNLTFDDNVNCIRYEDLKIASENNFNNHYNRYVGDSVDICEIKDVLDNNSSGNDIKAQKFIKNKLMTNDKNLIESSKQIFSLDSSAESISQSNLELESLNNNKENKSDTKRDIQKSNLCNNLALTSNIIFESSTDTAVSNDTRAANNMDLETAAITIQKVFRSFLFKSRASNEEVSSIDEENKDTNEYASSNINTERRPLGITRMDTVLQTVNEEKSLSLSTDDSSTLSSAATIIQAHIRGFLIRNKLNSNITTSTNSLLNSEDPVTTSMENDSNENQNNSKTILNIHIVPGGGGAPLSCDESFVTSMDLSLDSSPLSSVNLHPLGYDKSEPRKQLKREDAVQSISPPSNNSGKLSEDVDSAKEVLNSDVNPEQHHSNNYVMGESNQTDSISITDQTPFAQNNPDSDLNQITKVSPEESNMKMKPKRNSLSKMNSDEMDVVTPFTLNENQQLSESNSNLKLIHSGELHDVVLPTNVSRSSTSVVRGE